MSTFAVRAEGLGKRFRIGRVESAYRRLGDVIRGRERQWLWALEDVSFEIEEGSATAIIGRNGAGKSTLLKVLARITEPTAGYADVRGRVGALLEVGTGFHPELTGRENVYFNGTILGMRREEIARKFNDIVAFSGVERHIDTPVKWYSSGMYVRLGFAIAAYLEPEVLIVDEVLAVGDAEFQKRCLGRMGEVTHDGRTVLFVSHNMQAVRRLCERAILLDGGKLVAEGNVESVAQQYLASVDLAEAGRIRWVDPAHRPGNEICRIVEVRVTDDDDEPAPVLFTSRPIHVTIEFDLAVVHPAFMVAFDVITADGVFVLTSYHRDMPEDEAPRFVEGRNAFRCTIPPGLLNSGRYAINLRISLHKIRWIADDESVLKFDVLADHGESLFQSVEARSGVISPLLQWQAVEPTADADGRKPSAAPLTAAG